MKTALFIHSYAGANDTVRRHWPYYRRSGWDLFGVGRVNTQCIWPEAIPTKNIGIDAYIQGDNLPRRMADTFEWFLIDNQFNSYTHACIIEFDGIFLKTPPQMEISAAAHLAGGTYPGFKARQFHHCPWWLRRDRVEQFVPQARRFLEIGEYERGTPDFFFSWVLENLEIKITHLDGTFSRNSLDIHSDRTLCRNLIRDNLLWFVHGVKTEAQLTEILS